VVLDFSALVSALAPRIAFPAAGKILASGPVGIGTLADADPVAATEGTNNEVARCWLVQTEAYGRYCFRVIKRGIHRSPTPVFGRRGDIEPLMVKRTHVTSAVAVRKGISQFVEAKTDELRRFFKGHGRQSPE
jgi:hypothetical protein